MNWRKAAENDLRIYRAQSESLDNIRERIRALEIKRTAVRTAVTDSAPVHGGGSHYEDAILDSIVECERLKHTYAATRRLVELTERGLSGLDEQEQRVLELFYIDRQARHVDRLMEELGYEERQIYNIKDRALYKFTVSMYGLPDY